MQPKPIVRLKEDVVNRVAAGEVIHRPASALKELLENSLDAGSTTITVTVRDGGNKLLQVQDDGFGVNTADLHLLCERHTTSKLVNFEDLNEMQTFGFRGEALASMSFVANLTVTTMTKDAQHATRASYTDGKLTQEGTQPTAGVPGTTITVENLFFNVPTRKRALKSSSEEFAKVLEVTQRYAASRKDVAFVVRKLGDPKPSLRCPVVTNTVDRVRQIYGQQVGKNVLPLKFTMGGYGEMDGADAINGAEKNKTSQKNKNTLDTVTCSVDALVSTASHYGRKTVFILFINSRLVECSALKRACENCYSAILPKGEKPWMFVNLNVPANTLDVNVHPTKREVRFLHQDEIVEEVQKKLSEILESANVTRTFAVGVVGNGGAGVGEETDDRSGDKERERVPTHTQALLMPLPGDDRKENSKRNALVAVDEETGDPVWATHPPTKKPKTGSTRDQVARDNKLVRVDATQANLSLESFFHRKENAGVTSGDGHTQELNTEPTEPSAPDPTSDVALATQDASRRAQSAYEQLGSIPDSATSSLSSVKNLWTEITREAHDGLTKVLRGAVLVGKLPGMYSNSLLIQHNTKLHLVKLKIMLTEFWYQRVIARFGTFAVRRLSEPASVLELVLLALETERAENDSESIPMDSESVPMDTESETPQEETEELKQSKVVAAAVAELLLEKADMLREYFGLEFEKVGDGIVSLVSLPVLLEGFTPDLNLLPEFILKLAHSVEWGEEKSCFRTVAGVIAEFYAGGEVIDDEREDEDDVEIEVENPAADATTLQIKQLVFPAIRKFLRPSKVSHADGVVTQVASLEQLYRVFERC